MEHFTLVRPLVRSMIIATKEKRMEMRSHDASSMPLLVPKPVFTVVVPKGKWLVIGIEVVHSHEVQAALDSDIKLIAPDETPKYSPDAVPQNTEWDSWMNSRNLTRLTPSWLVLVMGLVLALVLACLFIFAWHLHKRLTENRKLLMDIVEWRTYVNQYRLTPLPQNKY
ncbi:hypothetical protein GCK32_010122 [Trichostrongylus colubriformis]|uniref:Uncharacterized protein n=1 Tax=Trichostrongylus colubriformis TaxID=6319 RepID=A0AAN8IQX9_TRICO